MKTNHRDGTVARQDHGSGWNFPLRCLKNATKRARRTNEREVLNAVRTGHTTAEDATFAGLNELEDLWNWD